MLKSEGLEPSAPFGRDSSRDIRTKLSCEPMPDVADKLLGGEMTFGGEMTYDMQLGLLATQAVTDLLRAQAQQDDVHYRGFLLKSADFCRSVRESFSSISLPSSTSTEVAAFLSAVMSLSEARSSEHERERLNQISQIEPVIARVLSENRRPNANEQIQIAEVLYSASAASFE